MAIELTVIPHDPAHLKRQVHLFVKFTWPFVPKQARYHDLQHSCIITRPADLQHLRVLIPIHIRTWVSMKYPLGRIIRERIGKTTGIHLRRDLLP